MVSPVGTFFIVLLVLVLVGIAGWVAFTQLRARRLGLPAPSLSSYNPFSGSNGSSAYNLSTPAPNSIRGWIGDKWRSLTNRRSATGAYEGAPSSRRGFGPLDPDDAWDARVNTEADPYSGSGAYYGDQELRSTGPRPLDEHNPYASPYNSHGNGDMSYPSQSAGGTGLHISTNAPQTAGGNPFDDHAAEPSNIGHTKRPISGTGPDSPTHSERRSVFREDV